MNSATLCHRFNSMPPVKWALLWQASEFLNGRSVGSSSLTDVVHQSNVSKGADEDERKGLQIVQLHLIKNVIAKAIEARVVDQRGQLALLGNGKSCLREPNQYQGGQLHSRNTKTLWSQSY